MALIGRDAVVIGATMGGLMTAAALSRHFEQITIVEQDERLQVTSSRLAIPHRSHPHTLLVGGKLALCELFPGFDLELEAAGAVKHNVGCDTRIELGRHTPLPPRDFGWTSLSMTHGLIEQIACRRLESLPNVTLRRHCRSLRIVPSLDSAAVAGVEFESDGGRKQSLRADLVVDASARGATTQSYLVAVGYPQAEETKIWIDATFATAQFRNPSVPRDWKVVTTAPAPGEEGRSGLLAPIEDGRWAVTLCQLHSRRAPVGIHEFDGAARQLRTNTIYDAVRHAELLGKVRSFRLPETGWRRFERLNKFPRGLLPIGDAICRLNPIHGQGLTLAAQEACLLMDLLDWRVAEQDPLSGLGQAFVAECRVLIASAWSRSTLVDLTHPRTRGERPPDLAERIRLQADLARAAARDAYIHKLLLRITHLVEPDAALSDPDLIERLSSGSLAA